MTLLPETGTALHVLDRTSTQAASMRVRMPTEFTAFCQLHFDHYLHYAQARLHDAGTSQMVVEHALGDLATAWPTALRSRATADFAWRTLSHRVTTTMKRQPTDTGRAPDGLHQLLAPTEADAVICHRLMSLSVPQTALLQGVQAETITRRLRGAAASLGTELAHLFGLRAAP